MLEPEEEYMLAKAWVEREDSSAAHKLVTSHLRLAAKIAMGYRGYGLPQAEVISEANVGLMQAVKRFDPEKGFRLATYAMWWIRASIQEYILRSWSLVKLGTTSAQKKLFFNLRKAKARIGALEEGDLRPEHVERIAHDLNVTEDEVISMNRRLAGSDASLNATVGSDDEGSMQWQDWLEDEDADQAGDYAERDELEVRREMLAGAMDVLNERERDILVQRRLQDNPVTLEELSEVYGVSRERIRQIEVRAFEKLQKRVQELAAKKGLLEPA
jgi:RNA polymerase sigma-32 factor